MFDFDEEKFDSQSKYESTCYNGLIHVDQFLPIPIDDYPYGSFVDMLYYAGEYVGTSYRIKASFKSWLEMSEYRIDHPEYVYTMVKLVCGRLE